MMLLKVTKKTKFYVYAELTIFHSIQVRKSLEKIIRKITR